MCYETPEERGAPELNARKGAANREVGINRAVSKSGDKWQNDAFMFAVEFARTHDMFKMEEVRVYAEARGLPEPDADPRCWSGVTRRMQKEKLVKKDGVVPSDNPKAHRGNTNILCVDREIYNSLY